MDDEDMLHFPSSFFQRLFAVSWILPITCSNSGLNRCLKRPCIFRYSVTVFFRSGLRAMTLLGAERLYSPSMASHNGNVHVSTAKREIAMLLLGSERHPLGQGAITCKKAGPSTSKPLLTFLSRSIQKAGDAVATYGISWATIISAIGFLS